jgi:hypothetical protein
MTNSRLSDGAIRQVGILKLRAGAAIACFSHKNNYIKNTCSLSCRKNSKMKLDKYKIRYLSNCLLKKTAGGL